jgi:hypothetical protein
MIENYPFTCNCCGKIYNSIPLCFGDSYPDYYYSIPPEEREKRIELTQSLCVIDDHFFHRGRIIIPINDYSEDLILNVWTTISKENFELRNTLWNEPDRINQDPYFGWLQTTIPTYGDTLNIKTIAREAEVGLIPYIEVIEDEHPLLHDQQNGISFENAVSKVQQILKDQHIG